jgi:hypothetical protein
LRRRYRMQGMDLVCQVILGLLTVKLLGAMAAAVVCLVGAV